MDRFVGIAINGVDLSERGVNMLRDYKIGGTSITNTIFQGRNRSSYRLLAAVYAQKPISFTLVYDGRTYREASLKRSETEAMMWGKCELFMPDGFYYTSTLQSIGEGALFGQDDNQILLEVPYELQGIQHDPLVTVPGENFFNPGSLPYTDCSVSATVSAAADTYALAGATFHNVTAGEKLEVDGINGRILRNGAPAPGNVDFIRFPQVTPGKNSFTALDPTTVSFYPSYI